MSIIKPEVQPPPVPVEPTLSPKDYRTKLVADVKSALMALPAHFSWRQDSSWSGIDARDLFHLNDLVSAEVENQVVNTLNRQRTVWDKSGSQELEGASFVRQSQAFPDAILVKAGDPAAEPIMGIELKAWFMLSSEKEAAYRFYTTSEACSEFDLLCVVPWHLDNVLSGQPVVQTPWVLSAKHAAALRNHHWQYTMNAKSGKDRRIKVPDSSKPYPAKNDNVVDEAMTDNTNFGRIARTPAAKEFSKAALETEVLGIRMADWASFLRKHSDKADLDLVTASLEAAATKARTKHAATVAARAMESVREMGLLD